MLRIALHECNAGVKIRYVINGEITVRTIADPAEIEQLILSLLYADDMAIVCDDPHDLEKIVVKLDEVLRQWGLEVSPEKTEVLSIDRYGRADMPEIVLREHKISNVERFKYLGTLFTKEPLKKTPRRKQKKKADKNTRKETSQEKKGKTAKKTSFLTANLENRITKANNSFYSYAAPLYRRKDIHMRYKLKIFKLTAIPTLLYGSEVWAPTKDEISRLESWQHRCIRYMMNIRYSTHGNVSSTELRKKTGLRTIHSLLRERRWKWLGHAARMNEERVPRKMLTGQLGRKRRLGKPRMSWKRIVNEDLQAIGCTSDYSKKAQDRKSWRDKIKGPYRHYSARPVRRSTRIAERGKKVKSK